MTIEPCHDKQAVQFVFDDGVQEVPLKEAKKYIDDLQKSVDALYARKSPPAPAPLTFVDFGHKSQGTCTEFTWVCSTKLSDKTCKPSYSIAGFEISHTGALKLQTWLNRAILYVES